MSRTLLGSRFGSSSRLCIFCAPRFASVITHIIFTSRQRNTYASPEARRLQWQQRSHYVSPEELERREQDKLVRPPDPDEDIDALIGHDQTFFDSLNVRVGLNTESGKDLARFLAHLFIRYGKAQRGRKPFTVFYKTDWAALQYGAWQCQLRRPSTRFPLTTSRDI